MKMKRKLKLLSALVGVFVVGCISLSSFTSVDETTYTHDCVLDQTNPQSGDVNCVGKGTKCNEVKNCVKVS